MRLNGIVTSLFVVLYLSSRFFSDAALAADHPVKMATEAYLSVRSDAAAGQLIEGRPELGAVTLQRMNWLPETEQPSAYFAKVSINHIAWRELAISFVPKNTGTVTLELYGPWEKIPNADIYRQDVWWDDVRVTGAELKNGGFEQPLDAKGSPWKSTGGSRVPSSKDAPSAEGQYQVRTWHNERVIASIAVQAGKRITVRAKAKSVRPDGFVEMRRIESKQTPAHQAAKLLRRGANLGNHLEVAPDQNWAIDYSDEDYDHIRAEGFDHVRLPVGWQFYTGSAPDFRLSDTIFAKVDKHIERAQKRKLAIIINIHHFDDFTTDPAKQRDRFLAIWKQIAERYSKLPDNLFFELLNEPKDAATTLVMNPIYAESIKLIRRSNPTRTILIGPGRWNSVAELTNLKLPDDDLNLIVSVHNYDPFHFTHQGATWAGPDVSVKGIRFPGPPAQPLVPDASVPLTNSAREWLAVYNQTPRDANPCSEATLRDVARTAKSWSDYYGRPIHFGEFGAFTEADAESRANFVRGFRMAFDEVDVGWAIWDWKAGFRYWDADHKQPSPGFREALFPGK